MVRRPWTGVPVDRRRTLRRLLRRLCLGLDGGESARPGDKLGDEYGSGPSPDFVVLGSRALSTIEKVVTGVLGVHAVGDPGSCVAHRTVSLLLLFAGQPPHLRSAGSVLCWRTVPGATIGCSLAQAG